MTPQEEKDLAKKCFDAKLYVDESGWMMKVALHNIAHPSTNNRYRISAFVTETGIPFACCILDLKERMLGTFVSPEYRRQGWGKRVVKKLLDEHKIDQDTVYGTEGQEGSEGLYKSCGILYMPDGISMTKEEGDLLMHYDSSPRGVMLILKRKNKRLRGEPLDLRVLPKFSDEHYFRNVGGNTYVGYHVEQSDIAFSSAKSGLSMETLSDDRLLFLCNNPDEWFPNHLTGHIDQDEVFQVYEVTFTAPMGLEFYKNDTFHSLHYLDGINGNKQKLERRANRLANRGFHLFVLKQHNDHNELSEAFLCYPKKYVKSIKMIRREEGIPL
jgi:GNAT superfamily N-acetyltransferase